MFAHVYETEDSMINTNTIPMHHKNYPYLNNKTCIRWWQTCHTILVPLYYRSNNYKM